jgi:multidrug resistance efflux pump
VIVVLLNVYIAILALFIWLKVLPFNLFWKISPVIVLLALLLGLFIPMGWGAPSGPVALLRNSVQIVPSVSGEVTEVAVTANAPLKAGDVLFRIDPTTYKAQVEAIEAQLKFAQLRLSQMTELYQKDAGRGFDVQQRQAEVDQLQAELDGAKWNLDKTTVVAPADGYVTNLALRKGARVTGQSPVMAFIDTSSALLGAEIPQINARYIEKSQQVEVTFKAFPGEVYTGRVEKVLQAISTGQAATSGLAVTPSQIQSAPFVVRIGLDDPEIGRQLPAGSTGQAAIFTDHVKASHVIRQVLLRQIAITNYINPF